MQSCDDALYERMVRMSDFGCGDSFDIPDAGSEIADISDEISADMLDIEADISYEVSPGIDISDMLDTIEPIGDSELGLNISDATDSGIDEFEQRIVGMSLEELNSERDLMSEMGTLNGDQLSQEYDEIVAEQIAQEQFDAITKNLSANQLKEMKSRILADDQEMLDFWDINNEPPVDAGDQKIMRR